MHEFRIILPTDDHLAQAVSKPWRHEPKSVLTAAEVSSRGWDDEGDIVLNGSDGIYVFAGVDWYNPDVSAMPPYSTTRRSTYSEKRLGRETSDVWEDLVRNIREGLGTPTMTTRKVAPNYRGVTTWRRGYCHCLNFYADYAALGWQRSAAYYPCSYMSVI